MLSRELEVALAVLALVIMALVQAAKRRPDVEWLRPFRPAAVRPEIEKRRRNRANRYAGAELILLGVILPFGYVALTVMMFNDFEPLWTIGVIAGSLVCITLGVTAIVKSR